MRVKLENNNYLIQKRVSAGVYSSVALLSY